MGTSKSYSKRRAKTKKTPELGEKKLACTGHEDWFYFYSNKNRKNWREKASLRRRDKGRRKDTGYLRGGEGKV